MNEFYTTLYRAHEENALLHPETVETAAAERELNEFLHSLPAETMFQLDALAGKLARAYEKQGFLFGLNAYEWHFGGQQSAERVTA